MGEIIIPLTGLLWALLWVNGGKAPSTVPGMCCSSSNVLLCLLHPAQIASIPQTVPSCPPLPLCSHSTLLLPAFLALWPCNIFTYSPSYHSWPTISYLSLGSWGLDPCQTHSRISTDPNGLISTIYISLSSRGADSLIGSRTHPTRTPPRWAFRILSGEILMCVCKTTPPMKPQFLKWKVVIPHNWQENPSVASVEPSVNGCGAAGLEAYQRDSK